MNKFDEWLDKNVPAAGGCLVAMDDTKKESVKYYLIVRCISGNGTPMFIVNGNFHWDYEEFFNSENWKIVYKRVVE